jgi:tRNA(Ile)-lysidine synthase
MNNKITNTIKKFNMISPKDTVLVAVSGGADSMLLLDYFVNNREILDVKIKVAHIEHGIRGQASIDDASFVKSYCDENNIEFHMLSINAVEGAKEAHMSVEEYSRNKRYEFFNTIECDKIATAHNLTDNVETILFRLARGTGLKGLCGIPPVRDKIIRPLIEISSSDIRTYCKAKSIKYRIDCTNLDNDYSRNKIRNEILPILNSVNNDYQNQINQLISDINEDNLFIEECVNKAYSNVLVDNKLLISELANLDVAIQKRVLQKYFLNFDIMLDRLHLTQILDLIYRSGKIQICGDNYAVSNKNFLRFARLENSQNNFNFVSQILNINEFNSKNVDFYCDCDKINGKVVIRSRIAGDKIRPANRNCEKTLKKLFNELAIPFEKRDNIPLVCDDKGVIGVVGYCVDERVKVDNNTKNVITIKIPLEDL